MGDLLSSLASVWDALRPILGVALCALGVSLALIGTAGVLRFPDFYTRLHAASVTDTSAVTASLAGMALLSPSWLVVFKLAMIWVFFFLTGPTASHAIANAAHVAGLQPWDRKGGGPDTAAVPAPGDGATP